MTGVVIVTGAAQGIGFATVESLVLAGYSVIGLDLLPPVEPWTLQDTNPQPVWHLCDVTDEAAIAEVVAPLSDVVGLVNCAGIASYANPVEMSEEHWDRVFAVDLKSCWLVAKHVIPHMVKKGQGSIVNVSSIHARLTVPGMFPYAAAKSGVIGLTRSLALDLAPEGIRVNAVSPGWTRTRLVDEYFQKQTDPDEALRHVLSVLPLGRMAEPREIADVITFLISESSTAITGAEINVDVGLGARFAT
ncbi:MAG: SDR family NAD(P)-dependent oxidoreductase [Candidatus Nanopelagicales bacterium]|jgi:NAD(P)-dependent dehydrogenase (short-subunit alcohol dehydrogenase family)